MPTISTSVIAIAIWGRMAIPPIQCTMDDQSPGSSLSSRGDVAAAPTPAGSAAGSAGARSAAFSRAARITTARKSVGGSSRGIFVANA